MNLITKQTNMSKPQSFYRENTTQSIEVPEVEFNEIKAKCNKNKSKSCFHKNLSPNGLLKAKYYIDDEGAIWLKDIVDKDFIEIYYNTPDADDTEEEEEEYEYTAYGSVKLYKVVINVAGGGLMNGNAYANIEGEWKTEDDFNDGEEGEIYYCEYGSYPSKRCVGTRIVWGDEDKFNIE